MKLEEYECVKTKRRTQARIPTPFSFAVGVSAKSASALGLFPCR